MKTPVETIRLNGLLNNALGSTHYTVICIFLILSNAYMNISKFCLSAICVMYFPNHFYS